MFIIHSSLEGTTNTVITDSGGLQWLDTIVSPDIFKREINGSTLYFKNGVSILKSKILKAKPIAQIKTADHISDNNSFMTFDVETIEFREKNIKRLKPYLISAFSQGTSLITHSITFTEDILGDVKYIRDITEDMFDEAVSVMFHKFIIDIINNPEIKYVYAHNFAKFDGPILLKHLLTFVNSDYAISNYKGVSVEPLIFNGKLMSLNLIINSNDRKLKRRILFKDSYLLFNQPLRLLAKTFKVASQKLFFPLKFYDTDALTTIFYKGIIPVKDYWGDIPSSTYNELYSLYQNKEWVYLDEATKYCSYDSVCLFEILVRFNELIFNNFKFNIHDAITLPSLAMKIFKSSYMPKDTIYQILGRVEADIREAYTGGAVDVYIPHNKHYELHNTTFNNIYNYGSEKSSGSKKLIHLDVNSLYPYVMKTQPVPTGKPIAFEGNVLEVNNDAYGFFYCKITTPKYLEHPILQRRVKTKDGIRTIAGLGSWEGWIYSEEMKNAIKYGYEFEVIRGYLFKPQVIFDKYVQTLYEMRQQYPSGSPMNLIAKLLMNSLYGKFGMRPEQTEITIVNTRETLPSLELVKACDKNLVVDIYNITDDCYAIIKNNVPQYKDDDGFIHGLDVNIGIAASITAGGRIHMSTFKNHPKIELYYSDTDSLIIAAPDNKDASIFEGYIGDKIGQLKVEGVIKDFCALGPKMYIEVDIKNEVNIKVKGLNLGNTSISFESFMSLLFKDSKLEVSQEKWAKKILSGNISIHEVLYTISQTSGKRKPIFRDIGSGTEIFDNTTPYNYNEFIQPLEKCSTKKE